MDNDPKEHFDSHEFLVLVAHYEQVVSGNGSAYFETEEIDQILDYYISRCQYMKALKGCDYAIEKFPFSYDFLSTKAEILICLDQLEEAIDLLKYQLSLGNASSVVFCLFGDAYLSNESYKLALTYYKKALDMSFCESERSEIYYDIAFVYQSMEQYSLSIKYLIKAIRADYTYTDAINELGVSIEITQEYEQGVQLFEEIINNNPYCEAAWYYLGLIYKSQDKFKEAANAIEYATIIDPKSDLAWSAYADILFELGQFQEALDVYQKLEAEGDASDELYKRIGLCYYQMENIGKAKTYYNKGIKHCVAEEFTDELWYLLGEAFEAEDNYVSAKKCYATALAKYDSEIYWAALAFVEQELGNYDQALKYYSNSVEGDPYNEALWEAYAHCMIEFGEIEKSIDLLESGLVIMPKSANLRYLLSGCMFKGGISQQGNTELQKALNMNYQEHQTMFEYFPELQGNKEIINLIEQFKSK